MHNRIGVWFRCGDLAVIPEHTNTRKATFHFYSDLPKLFSDINIAIEEGYTCPDPLQHKSDVSNKRFQVRNRSQTFDFYLLQEKSC